MHALPVSLDPAPMRARDGRGFIRRIERPRASPTPHRDKLRDPVALPPATRPFSPSYSPFTCALRAPLGTTWTEWRRCNLPCRTWDTATLTAAPSVGVPLPPPLQPPTPSVRHPLFVDDWSRFPSSLSTLPSLRLFLPRLACPFLPAQSGVVACFSSI